MSISKENKLALSAVSFVALAAASIGVKSAVTTENSDNELPKGKEAVALAHFAVTCDDPGAEPTVAQLNKSTFEVTCRNELSKKIARVINIRNTDVYHTYLGDPINYTSGPPDVITGSNGIVSVTKPPLELLVDEEPSKPVDYDVPSKQNSSVTGTDVLATDVYAITYPSGLAGNIAFAPNNVFLVSNRSFPLNQEGSAR